MGTRRDILYRCMGRCASANFKLLPGVGGTRVSGMILPLTPPCLRGTSAATIRRMHLRMRAIASGRRALSNEGPCCEIGGGHSFGPSALRPGAQKSEPDRGRKPMRQTLLFSGSQFQQIVRTDRPTQSVDHHTELDSQLQYNDARSKLSDVRAGS